MECTDIRARLLQGGDLGPAAAAHAAECPACAALLADGGRVARLLGHPEHARVDVDAALATAEAAMAREVGVRARLRSASTRVRLSMMGLAGASVALAFLVLRPRPDLAAYPRGRLALSVVLLLAATGVGMRMFARPLYLPSTERRRSLAILGAALALPFVLAALPQAHGLPVSLGGTGDDLLARALVCVRTGLMAAAPVALTLWLVDRGTAPWVLGAVTAGVTGTLALELHCPLTSPAHLLLGHATIAPIAMLAALALGRLRPSTRG
jgi:hypothetical protein